MRPVANWSRSCAHRSRSKRRGSNMPDHVGVALLVVAEQVGVELRGPGHPALEEREVQVGEAARHPAHHQGPAGSLLGGGEVAQVVVHVVRRRHPAAPAVPHAVERGCHPELRAARPQRVVVVEAAVPERVDPRAGGAVGTRRAGDHAVHHHRLQPERPDRVVELGDRLLGRERGDDRDRFEAVAVARVHLRVVGVQGARDRPAHLVVGDREHGQAEARVQQEEVEADLLGALGT